MTNTPFGPTPPTPPTPPFTEHEDDVLLRNLAVIAADIDDYMEIAKDKAALIALLESKLAAAKAAL